MNAVKFSIFLSSLSQSRVCGCVLCMQDVYLELDRRSSEAFERIGTTHIDHYYVCIAKQNLLRFNHLFLCSRIENCGNDAYYTHTHEAISYTVQHNKTSKSTSAKKELREIGVAMDVWHTQAHCILRAYTLCLCTLHKQYTHTPHACTRLSCGITVSCFLLSERK